MLSGFFYALPSAPRRPFTKAANSGCVIGPLGLGAFTKGCKVRAVVSGRDSGSLVKHLAKKWWHSGDQGSGAPAAPAAGDAEGGARGAFRVGARLMVISNRARSAGSRSSGGSFSHISITVMPKLHTSTRASYVFPATNSGAIQKGVPTVDCRLDRSLVVSAAKPKSASLTDPDRSTSTLSLLMSRLVGKK